MVKEKKEVVEEIATETKKMMEEVEKQDEIVEEKEVEADQVGLKEGEVEAESKVEAPKEVKKSTVSKDVEAVINIYSSFNNTIAHVTDMSGRTITKITGGMVTKHNRLKANPTIAMFIAKRIAEEVKDSGIKSFYIRVRAKTRNPAPGPGAHNIVKSLTREGFRILNILDTTRLPRGGPKVKGGRRGRRP